MIKTLAILAFFIAFFLAALNGCASAPSPSLYEGPARDCTRDAVAQAAMGAEYEARLRLVRPLSARTAPAADCVVIRLGRNWRTNCPAPPITTFTRRLVWSGSPSSYQWRCEATADLLNSNSWTTIAALDIPSGAQVTFAVADDPQRFFRFAWP